MDAGASGELAPPADAGVPDAPPPPSPSAVGEASPPPRSPREAEGPDVGVTGPPPVPLNPPRTAPPPVFGSPGEWVVLASSSSAGVSTESFNNSDASFLDASIEVGIDYFVVRNLSLGIDLFATYGDNKSYGATTLEEDVSSQVSGGVRFGVNVPMGGLVSWYPRLTVGFESNHLDVTMLQAFGSGQSPGPGPSSSSVGPWINLYMPLLFHPSPHFVLGFGPRLQHHFDAVQGGPYDGSESTLVSFDFVVGGWGGGPSPDGAVEGAGAEPSPTRNVFGKAGHVVLTNATGISFGVTSYSQAGTSATSVNVAPGFDYFVADNVSLGLDGFGSYTSGSTPGAPGVATDFTTSSFGAAPRLGGVLSIVPGVVSVWPLIELGYGAVNYTTTSALGTNSHQISRSWIEVMVPVLYHIAPPFFVGAGPYVFQELSDSDQNGFENKATQFGATFWMGGAI